MLALRRYPPRLKFKLPRSERAEEINMVLSAFRSLRSPTRIGYLSTPITTGPLFYLVLEKYQAKNLAELSIINPHLFYREVVEPNISRAKRIGNKLSVDFHLPLIVPAVFEAHPERWRTEDYMFIWLQVIREIAGQVVLNDGWEYSNGGTEEFVCATEVFYELFPDNTDGHYRTLKAMSDYYSGIPMKITDSIGRSVNLVSGAIAISNAIIDLHVRGFVAKKLFTALAKLKLIADFVHANQGLYSDESFMAELNLPLAVATRLAVVLEETGDDYRPIANSLDCYQLAN